MKISEAQTSVREIMERHKFKRSPLASLVGVYEELGELSSDILEKEDFKRREHELKIDYKLAEVLFELLKLAEDCDIDLEAAFTNALERWKRAEPLWK